MDHQENVYDPPDLLDDEEVEDKTDPKQRKGFVKCICDNKFMLTIILGVIIGFAIGFGIREAPVISDEVKVWISMPGDLYIRLLKLTILPLIASNIIIVIAKLDPKENGKISIVAFVYIVVANIIGASVGMGIAAAIRPGTLNLGDEGPKPDTGNHSDTKSATTSDVFADLFLNIFPDNIVGIALFQVVTSYTKITGPDGSVTFKRVVGNEDGSNMIGIIFVAAVFGLSANAAKENGEAFLEFFSSMADVVLKLIRAFLKLTPIGVCFMIAGAVIKVDDIAGTFAKLGFFIITCVVATAIMFLLIILVFFVGTRRNPFALIPHLLKAWFITFATTSAVVSIPEIFEGCDEMNIRKGTSRFVAPLAATLKADGSATFIAAASTFVAQLEGAGDQASTLVVIWLLTSALAIAIPHIPSSSIVIIITILTSVGVPVGQVSLLYATEWLLDRIRSGLSALSTFYCTVFTDYVTLRSERKKGQQDEFDDAMSQLSASAKSYKSSLKHNK